MMDQEIRLALEGLGVSIPDLHNIVARLGTDREAVNCVLAILGDIFDHCSNGISHEGCAGLALQDAETVGTAIDIIVILPERGDIIAHKEEHSIAQGVNFEG